MMGHTEAYPQSVFQNPMQWGQSPQAWGLVNPQIAQSYASPQGGLGQQGWIHGLGQAAFGQSGLYGSPFGQSAIGAWGQGPWGQASGWGPQRQLSHQDVGEVVRQLLPLLPQVVAQAQQQPQAAFGYGPYNQLGPYAQAPRTLTQQDVNEVVRQILPIVPQIVSLLQGQQGPLGAAIHGGPGGGYGQPWQVGQTAFGQAQSPFGLYALGQNPWGQYQQQQPIGQFGSLPPYQAAFGGNQTWGQSQQRQLNQADVGEVVRQLTAIIPQLIANLQALNQQQQQRAV
jgi:hypothetical protein